MDDEIDFVQATTKEKDLNEKLWNHGVHVGNVTS